MNKEMNASEENRRFELLVHTEYGNGDATCKLKDIVEKAYDADIAGIAVTDHMSIASYPEILFMRENILEKKYPGFKIFYGMTATIIHSEEFKKDLWKYLPFQCKGSEALTDGVLSYNVSILIKNAAGRRNLYYLLSKCKSHYPIGKYFDAAELFSNREGLLIGSGNYNGELFRTLLYEQDDDKIKTLVDKYDYLEIQPPGNSRLFMYEENVPFVSEDRLNYINRQIVLLGERYDKPVIASGDIRFLRKDDFRSYAVMEHYRFNQAQNERFEVIKENIPDTRYFHSTESLFKEFEYLRPEERQKVIIDNTNRVAMMIDQHFEIDDGMKLYEFDKEDECVAGKCEDRLKAIYGRDIPAFVKERLDKEIHLIKKNNYQSYYVLAQKAAELTRAKGCVQMIRDLSGGSLVAYLLGITGIDPQKPYYYCENKDYVEEADAGIYSICTDLPDRNCPNCGKQLIKAGFNLPYEFFMGADGEKTPDFNIDVPVYARDEVVDTISRKTCGAWMTSWVNERKRPRTYLLRDVKKYYETVKLRQIPTEMQRTADGVTCLEREYIEHPGTLVLAPNDKEIYNYTPLYSVYEKTWKVPYSDSGIKSQPGTMYDKFFFKDKMLTLSLYENKTMDFLSDLVRKTGVNIEDISFSDKRVLDFFKNESFDDQEARLAGLSVFDSKKFIGYRRKYKINSFSDILRACIVINTSVDGEIEIHGEESYSWGREGLYYELVSHSVPKDRALEFVNELLKYRQLQEKDIELIKYYGLSDKFKALCDGIKEAAYKSTSIVAVMTSWYLAYFKCYYPKQFYASYYSCMAVTVNYETTKMTYKQIVLEINQIRRIDHNKLKKEDLSKYKDYLIIKDMYDQEYNFAELDPHTAAETEFIVTEERGIMPSLNAAELGENDRDHFIYFLENEGPFYSMKEAIDLFVEMYSD